MKLELRPLLIALSLLSVPLHAEWIEISPGVEYREFQEDGLEAYVARIDLREKSIRVLATSESERGMRLRAFAAKHDAVVAINGDFFDEKLRPIGLAIGPCGIWDGTRDTKREGFVALGTRRAEIYRQSLVIDPPPAWVEHAVSGWPMIVRACRPLSSKELPGSDAFTRAAHPRTAVGLSKDRRTLLLVVVDGRRDAAPGVTLARLASFMQKELGACAALNLDGGGSSEMVVDGEIMNQPSDGTERRVSNHLAVVPADSYRPCETPEEMAEKSK